MRDVSNKMYADRSSATAKGNTNTLGVMQPNPDADVQGNTSNMYTLYFWPLQLLRATQLEQAQDCSLLEHMGQPFAVRRSEQPSECWCLASTGSVPSELNH